MKGKTKELWEKYCEQAAVEQDPDALMQLVQEINRMLEEKEKHYGAANQRMRNLGCLDESTDA